MSLAMFLHHMYRAADVVAGLAGIVGPIAIYAIKIDWKIGHGGLGRFRVDNIFVASGELGGTFDFRNEVSTLLQAEALMVDLQMCL